MISVAARDCYAAYRDAFFELHARPRSLGDPELLRESPGQILICGSDRGRSPLFIDNKGIHGCPRYNELTRRGDVVFRAVKSHYEKLLLRNGALERLIANLASRPLSKRLIETFWLPEYSLGDTSPCLIYLWFRLDGDVLHCHAHMRATDVYRKLLMNLHILTAGQEYVARRIGYRTGDYLHLSDSMHFYEADRLDIDHTAAILSSTDSLPDRAH